MEKSRSSIAEHTVVLPQEGKPFAFGEVGGLFKIVSEATEGRFTVAQFPTLPPHTLGAPLHRHHNEDEYTYVLEGTVGILNGSDVLRAGPGTWVLKPRGRWHTFWNGEDSPSQLIEIVSPAGFENYFGEVAEAGGDKQRLAIVNQKYSIDMDFDSIPKLCQRFGLTFAG